MKTKTLNQKTHRKKSFKERVKEALVIWIIGWIILSIAIYFFDDRNIHEALQDIKVTIYYMPLFFFAILFNWFSNGRGGFEGFDSKADRYINGMEYSFLSCNIFHDTLHD